jgi:LacI family transcriptional regulator
MAEIARRCRLSKATVSRALSLPLDRSPVTPRTRERILRVAKDLQYRPNWRARAFSRGQTHTVGLITSGLLPQHETIPHLILESFGQVLRSHGYHLSLVPVDGALDWRDLVFGGHVDGCATINDPPDDVVQEIRRSKLPAVAMNASPRAPLPVVTADDHQGGVEVGQYLHSLGHRRIAMYVNKDAVSHYSQRERLRGVMDGMSSAGARQEDEELIIQFVREQHEPAMQRLLEQETLPTAIVCYSHYEAVPILQELWRRGLRVPNDMSVIAFNDVFPLECTIPPLTAVAVPADQIGRNAADQLLAQIHSGQRPRKPASETFAEQLIIRESCGRPRDE